MTGQATIAALMRRILRAGAVTLALAAPVCAAGGWLYSGGYGLWGALAGLAVPVLFYLVTVLAALGTSRMPVTLLGPVVLGSWLLKLVLMIVALSVLKRFDFFDESVFATVAIAGTVGFLALETVVVIWSRVPYVEPAA